MDFKKGETEIPPFSILLLIKSHVEVLVLDVVVDDVVVVVVVVVSSSLLEVVILVVVLLVH